MIVANGRYAQTSSSSVIDLKNSDGTIVRTVFRRPPLRLSSSFSTYRWKKNDRIDLIAQHFLGDGSQWWRIADVNPHITNFGNITPGEFLRIPRV